MAYQIFISYRRSDQNTLAEWLHERLSREIPADEIFLDTSEINPGDTFPDRLADALRSAMVFVIVMGAGWEGRDPANPTGPRRLDDPGDYVRKEAALALAYARDDRRKLVLPVLCGGLHMLAADALPEELRALHTTHAFNLQPKRQGQGIQEIVGMIAEHIDNLGGVPDEERWILHHISMHLENLGRNRIRPIANLLAGRFPDIGNPPDSSRSLAAAIYRLGPPAMEFLLLFSRAGEDFRPLLQLLATYWINAGEVAALRRAMVPAPVGKRFAIECRYTDFTPRESLLKASRHQSGWPQVAVKASDPPAEIVRQVHDSLLERFSRQMHSPGSPTTAQDPASSQEKQRERICEILHSRIETERQALPVVLRLDHLAALDGSLVRAVQNAFPPLHILIATANPNELKQLTKVSKIVRPSDRRDAEQEAYAAFAEAEELLGDHELGPL